MSTKFTMLPEYCKILMRHEVQKQFESGRRLIEVVLKVFQTHMKSFKSQAKERDEADGNLRQLGVEHEDIKEVLLTLATLQKDTSTTLMELSKKLDGPVRTLNRWLNDPSTRESESSIMEQIDKLTGRHTQTMGRISKLHKVSNKKIRLMEKVQQQIDSYPNGGQDDVSISELEIKLEHFRVEAEAARQRYRHALDTELRNRQEFIMDAEELEFLFVKHEEKRLLTLVDCIGKYSSILTGYNNPRDKILSILTDLTELSMIYSPDDEIKKFLARGCRDLTFPVPQVFKEDLVAKKTSHHTGQDDLELDLKSCVTSKAQLTKTSDTSGNANKKFDEKNDDRTRDIYAKCLDNKASCLPFNPFHGSSKNSGSAIHLNTPKDMSADDYSPPGLPLMPTSYLSEDIPVKTSPKLVKMEGLPQIASPETAIQRIMSRDEKRPAQLLRSDSSLEGNLLPKLTRSTIGTPEMTSSPHNTEVMNQFRSKPRQNADDNLPLMPKPMVDKRNVPTTPRSEFRNGSSSSHPALRANSRMEANVLPKMPSTGKNMLSSFNAESNQDNVRPGELPPWVKSQTTSLPQLSRTNEGNMKSSNLQPSIMVSTVPTKLPVMQMPGTNTANALRSYSRPESQSAMQNRKKEGFSILPSKPKVLMDSGNPKSAMVRYTTENVASDTLRSRNRVGVVRQSGQVDSGIAAGFRGSSSNRDFRSQQGTASARQGPHGMVNTLGSHGMVNTPQGPHRVVNTHHKPQGMARAPYGPRGKADGAPYVQKSSDTLCSNPAIQPAKAQAGTTSWTRKESLLTQGSVSCVEGNKKEKSQEQVRFSNADRLLNKYDIRNLGIGDNEEEEKEDICKKADELLAKYDIGNICSESSLVEQEV